MSADRPSLEAQAARWRVLDESMNARIIRAQLQKLVQSARDLGLRIEVREVSHAYSMGATHEEITVTPSREGYQSTN